MELPVLPDKYYLSHFFELLDFLEQHYQPVLSSEARHFINDFRALSEQAQCVYVRMANRKGLVFAKNTFSKYSEIENSESAFQELQLTGFISPLKSENKSHLFPFLTKAHLAKWLQKCGLQAKATFPREKLVEIAENNIDQLELLHIPDQELLAVQMRSTELDYLLFLYFGKIQSGLSLYTLRDLGIRKANQAKINFKPRYYDLEHAQVDYFFSRKISDIETEDFKILLDEILSQKTQRTSSVRLKNQLLLDLAELAEPTDLDMAMQAWENCTQHPAREKQIRVLYKLEKSAECQDRLEAIIQNPFSDEELLFAEDFLSRKFGKKKVGYLTEVLQNADEITLSESFLKRPEQGVCEYYRDQGFDADFTENELWNGLFGLLFWDELFESENAAIHNPFERTPADLVDPEFYEINKLAIEYKLGLLKDTKVAEKHILKMFTLHHGKLNDIFLWTPGLIEICLKFLKNSLDQNVACILRTMCQKYANYHSGFPDLMLLKDGKIQFVEVKAEGDSLRSKQLSKLRLLKAAGFSVDIMRVHWKTDPQQIYAVVDIETTGGSSRFHRITELGVVLIRDGKEIDKFQTLINPGRPIPKFITQITGISDDMVEKAPTFAEVAEKLNHFTQDAIFVAHNAKFDYGFIQNEFQRLEIHYVRPVICTVQGMRKKFPGLESYSLKSLTEHFQIPLKDHHRALCDAQAAAQLLCLMNSWKGPQIKNYVRDEYSTEFPCDFDQSSPAEGPDPFMS